MGARVEVEVAVSLADLVASSARMLRQGLVEVSARAIDRPVVAAYGGPPNQSKGTRVSIFYYFIMHWLQGGDELVEI